MICYNQGMSELRDKPREVGQPERHVWAMAKKNLAVWIILSVVALCMFLSFLPAITASSVAQVIIGAAAVLAFAVGSVYLWNNHSY